MERAEKHFGKIPKRAIPQRNRPRASPPGPDDRIVLLDPNARETYWARAYVAPSFAKGGDGAVAATAVLRELLAAEPAGFLHRDLIDLWYLVEHIGVDYPGDALGCDTRSEEHTSELQSLMRISYAVFCLKKQHK